MATPPSDSGIRANETNAGSASADVTNGSWRKKLRWWRFNAPRTLGAGFDPGAGVDNLLLEDGSDLLLEDGSVLLKE